MSVEGLTEEIDTDRIDVLVGRYRAMSEHDRQQKDEADVRQQFINPLLRALQWDTTTDQVIPEQRTLVGYADYALSLNGREQFYIETKAFREDLDGTRPVRGERQSYVEQAIDYAWHQGCDWAVLTNFAELRLYFTHVSKERLEDGLVFSLETEEFVTEEGVEKLTHLSKPAVASGSLEQLERARDRETVTQEVLNVLSEARVKLTTDVWESENVDLEELREGVQRILDRLVVMRVAEDWAIIHQDSLRKLTETWEETAIDPEFRTLMGDLRNAFRDFDSVYNSALFEEHQCEKYDVSNDVLKEIIDTLYDYNFAYIDADVLGSIYEDYLGHAIEDKQDDLELVGQADERREDGIYYTPVPVVEYIVDCTLGERLDAIMADVRTELDGEGPDFEAARNRFDDIENLRFLDVSCGSGSFLIKAYELFVDCYEEFDELVKDQNGGEMDLEAYSGAQTIPSDYRTRILENNIYGVDLDYQATEIATVNLLLQALRKGERLPSILEENIKCGNSLLNGSAAEVANVFDVSEETAATEYRAFDWKAEFPDVFGDAGGFDVIAGNPPWGAEMEAYGDWLEHDEYGYELADGQYDSYELFLELGGDVLRDSGTMGFIIPDTIISRDTSQLREWLTETRQIDRVFKLGEGLFENVFAGTAIIQYTNKPPSEDTNVEVGLIQKEDRNRMMGSGGEALASILTENSHVTRQYRFSGDDGYTFAVWAAEADHQILDCMDADTVPWEAVIDNGRGDEIGRDGNVLQCPYCTEWTTFPRKRAADNGGGYYDKTCTHCKETFEFEKAISTRQIIQKEPTDECDTPVYFGEHVNRYRTSDCQYIDEDVTGIGLKDGWRYEPPKLLIRQASVGFFATVDDTDARCLQAVFSFRLKEDRDSPYDEYDVEYFLGCLNSRAMLFYYAKTEGITEWQSYPRHTQTSIMSLPVPAIDFDDDEQVTKYEELVELVRVAIEADGKPDMDLDWEIERLVLDLYGIPRDERPRIWNEIKKMQRLRIVRELFPDEDDE